MINVLLADDHQIVIEGLEHILREKEDIRVIGTANDGNQVLKILEKEKEVDIAILDIEMPGINGVELSKIIKKEYPGIKIVILSMYNQKKFILELMNLGISGYILKNKSKEQLIHAIHQVQSGSVYFGLEVLNAMSQKIDSPPEEKTQLTIREKEILACIGEGMATKEISSQLNINETTVNTHKRNLLNKLDVPNDKHLVRYAIKHGYSKLN